MTTLSNFANEINTQINALQERLKTETKEVLIPAFKDFFDKNPEVKKVCWAQYTPYFNDGEECIFHIHGVYFLFEDKYMKEYMGSDEYDADEDSFWDLPTASEYSLKGLSLPQSTKDAVMELDRNINSLEEGMKFAFGDHAFVSVTREGITVEMHEHE